MSIFDGVLKRIGSAPDSVAHLAANAGIDLAMAEIAIEALGQSYQMEGDTVQLASIRTGLEPRLLAQIVQQIGGEGFLTEFAEAISNPPSTIGLFDRDGDGSPLNDFAKIARGPFRQD